MIIGARDHKKTAEIPRVRTLICALSDGEQSDISGEEIFTGHDGPAGKDVYCSVVIFTSDQTSGPVGSFLPGHH